MRLEIDPADLRPIVEAAVTEVLRQRAETDGRLNGKLGYTEREAAAALGIATHRLRDSRLRGEIHARLVGRGYVYSRGALVAFLAQTD